MTTAVLRAPLYADGAQLRRIAAQQIRKFCEVPELISVTEYAERHRILPETSTSPGPYDPSVIPYVRRPQDLMGDPSVPMVVLCWGSQMTKSTLIENAMMHRICRMPSPIVAVQPKIDAAESWSKERFDPMVKATPKLRSRVRLGRSSDSTLRYKRFPGGFLFVASAQSATELASRSAPFVFLDEVDRYETIPGEGNPVEIVMRRQGAADIGLAVLTSTPRDADSTIIWPYLEDGTYELLFLPCPHCGFMQPLTWQNLRWDDERPESAHYVCAGRAVTAKMVEGFVELDRQRKALLEIAVSESDVEAEDVDDTATWRPVAIDRDDFALGGCGGVITEEHKQNMLAAHQWRAANPSASYPSFHLNSLYSPFQKSNWQVLVREWERAQGKPADLQVFINTRLAELWEETKEAADPNSLFNRLEFDLLEGVVPRGAAVLTAGVDVQGNRLEVYVWAWGARLESWLVASTVIPGDPQREPDAVDSVWGKLDEYLSKKWPHQDSGGVDFMPISVKFVDSGHAMTQVYRFTNARKGQQVFACKGVGGDGVELLGKPSPQGRDRVIMYPVGTDRAKTEFIRSQLLEAKPGPGFVHLGGWLTKDQCAQLVSEKRKRKLTRGRVTWFWGKKREDDPNEALDCRNYARAALEAIGTKAIAILGDTANLVTEQAKSLAAAGNVPSVSAVAGSGSSRMISRGLPRDN